MARTNPRGPTTSIERLDAASLERRLRDAARRLVPGRAIDDLEVRHLTRVVTECSLLLTDVYSEDRLTRILSPERPNVHGTVAELLERQRSGEDEILTRVKRLPDDMRVVADKALFDVGLLGLRAVHGHDLEEIGTRAYRMAGRLLELLATDRQLRRFFQDNRLLMLPLEEEVVFLRQCAEQFRTYADILHEARGAQGLRRRTTTRLAEIVDRVPLMAAAAEALLSESAEETEPALEPADDPYLAAARGDGVPEGTSSKEHLISAYERTLLFSALDLGALRSALEATVIDQPQAVATLCDEFSLFAAGTRDPRKPPAYFLVGPTGVGKNHLVESLRRVLQGVWQLEVPMLTIEGPSYTYPSDIHELRGATRGFIRSDEEGLLTAFHEKSSRAPFAILLVDEVDKAHPQLLTFFLSILDRGTTTDNRGQLLNFANCMVFFTSNLGYSDAQQRSAPIGYADADARAEAVDSEVRREVRRMLKPEFVNRLRMIHFGRLGQASVERILDLEMARIARRYDEMHGLSIVLDPSARAELLRRGFSPDFGARPLAAVLESVCNVEIARKVRADDRGRRGDRRSLLGWLRDMRAGKRAYSAEHVRRRVLSKTRADLDYDTLRIVFDGRAFVYVPGSE
jgi:hypothetical protein